jgi:hypothetical protein
LWFEVAAAVLKAALIASRRIELQAVNGKKYAKTGRTRNHKPETRNFHIFKNPSRALPGKDFLSGYVYKTKSGI